MSTFSPFDILQVSKPDLGWPAQAN
jgi:hypothetical protein